MSDSNTLRRDLVLSLGLLFLIALGLVWLRTATVEATYLFVQQEEQLKKLKQEIQKAKVEWLKNTAPHHLDALAKKNDLLPPSVDQVLKYEFK